VRASVAAAEPSVGRAPTSSSASVAFLRPTARAGRASGLNVANAGRSGVAAFGDNRQPPMDVRPEIRCPLLDSHPTPGSQ